MKSSMFLREVTVIDHAFIGSDGRQHGGSFLASFDVTGKVDPTEKVVVDFSTIKKDIKAIVDDRDQGFDHKLWVITPFSGQVDLTILSGDVIEVKTQCLEISAPTNIIKTFDAEEYSVEAIGDVIGRHVEAELRKKYTGVEIEVKCHLSETPVSIKGASKLFRYSHGLKDSTSWGCQNIAHGHLSFIELHGNEHWRENCQDCIQSREAVFALLENSWDGAVLVNPENVIDDNADFISIGYTTPRGGFYAKYRKPWCKVKVLPGETTIEMIVDEFTREAGYWLERGHIGRIEISEGLSKGAFKEINHG